MKYDAIGAERQNLFPEDLIGKDGKKKNASETGKALRALVILSSVIFIAVSFSSLTTICLIAIVACLLVSALIVFFRRSLLNLHDVVFFVCAVIYFFYGNFSDPGCGFLVSLVRGGGLGVCYCIYLCSRYTFKYLNWSVLLSIEFVFLATCIWQLLSPETHFAFIKPLGVDYIYQDGCSGLGFEPSCLGIQGLFFSLIGLRLFELKRGKFCFFCSILIGLILVFLSESASGAGMLVAIVILLLFRSWRQSVLFATLSVFAFMIAFFLTASLYQPAEEGSVSAQVYKVTNSYRGAEKITEKRNSVVFSSISGCCLDGNFRARWVPVALGIRYAMDRPFGNGRYAYIESDLYYAAEALESSGFSWVSEQYTHPIIRWMVNGKDCSNDLGRGLFRMGVFFPLILVVLLVLGRWCRPKQFVAVGFVGLGLLLSFSFVFPPLFFLLGAFYSGAEDGFVEGKRKGRDEI